MDALVPLGLGEAGSCIAMCRLLLWSGDDLPDCSSVGQVMSLEADRLFDPCPGWGDIGFSRGFSYGWRHWADGPRYELLRLHRAGLEPRWLPSLRALAVLMQTPETILPREDVPRAFQGVVFETGTVDGEIISAPSSDVTLSLLFHRRRELLGAWHPQDSSTP